MRPQRILLHFLLLGVAPYCAGCALVQPDCAQDWYDAGQRDGRLGQQPWDVQHADRCGARFDRSRYVNGWQAGASARPSLGGM